MAPDPARGSDHAGRGDGSANPRRRAPLVPQERGAGGGHDLTSVLLSSVLVVGGIGWLLDRWLGTTPWGVVLGILAGGACGLYLIAVHTRSADEVERLRRHRAEQREMAAARRSGRRREKGEQGARG